MMNRHKYDAFIDNNAPIVILKKQTQAIYDEYKHQQERMEDRKWVYEQVMKAINIRIKDEASPSINEIVEQINRLIK